MLEEYNCFNWNKYLLKEGLEEGLERGLRKINLLFNISLFIEICFYVLLTKSFEELEINVKTLVGVK